MNERILLIDDHTLFRAGLSDLLTRRKIEVVASVGEGTEGLQIADKEELDIVLLDMRMPEMDGIESTRRIREFENEIGENNPITIIALTANAMKGDKEECINAGMNEYMSKPFKPAELKRVLSKIENSIYKENS